MKNIKLLFTIAILAISASVGLSQSITTTFAGGNGGASGWAVMYDATIAGSDLDITGFDVNTSSGTGTAFTLDVYITAPNGSYLGNQLNAGAWSLAGTGNGTSAGGGNPSNVTLNAPVTLSANTTYGIAIVLNGASPSYTNGNGGNQNYANADISLALGSSTSGLFTGSLFNPRVWNGTIFYTVSGGPSGPCVGNIPDYANVNPTGNGGPSQEFEAGFAAFTSEMADDFIPSQNATLCEIDIIGTGGGIPANPANSVILTVYDDAGGSPGNSIYTETFPSSVDADGDGDFTLSVSAGSPVLTGGTTYWLSVVVDMDFGCCGQWFWSTASDGNGNAYQWQNPGGGFGLGCTSWTSGQACGIASGTGPDLLMTISFNDAGGNQCTIPPTVVCPPDITVACEDEIMLDPNDATATANCPNASIVALYIKNPDAMGAPGCDGTEYVYTYVAVDDLGNQGTCTQTVTIENTPATISVPAGGSVTCFEDIDLSVNDATVENVCADFELYLAPPVITGEFGCPGTTYTYTYRVVDVCGNTIEEDVVFTNGANAGPTIEAPADITCECLAGVNPNPNLATVSTACGNAVDSNVEVSGPQVIGPMDCPGTRYIYTYTVTDACGRTASDQQTFTINNGPPVFQNCPDDNWLVLNCEDYGGEEGTIAVIEAWIASVTATNSCGMPLTVFNNFNSNNIGTCINDGYTNVTFRATDNCGRTSFCTGTVVVIDTEAPMIVEEAQDHYEVCNYLTQENLDDWVDANGGAVAFDGCSNDLVFWSTIPNNPTINCAGQMGTTEVTVTFVARDNCGNKSETTATFYALMATNDLVQDNGPADLDNEVSGLTMDQNRPNPFKDETLISFSLPEATSATLTIFDVNGRLLKSFQGDYAEGYNEVSISKSELGGTGIMYYQLVTEHGSVTKTMLVME